MIVKKRLDTYLIFPEDLGLCGVEKESSLETDVDEGWRMEEVCDPRDF